MNKKRNLNIVLFALTGFGNPVLKALLIETRVNVRAVVTVKYANAFPYYPEQHLDQLCGERGVACYHGIKVSSPSGIELVAAQQPDLILVATFKQILKRSVLAVPELGVVNFHPSLLPQYRGPCPSNAALLNGEQETGVTAHYVTEGLDDGDILLQKAIAIREQETDGQLRGRLSDLCGNMVPDLIDLFDGRSRPVGIPQDHSRATLAPKPTVEDGYLEADFDISTICRKVRALNPIPGTSILLEDRRVAVDRCELFQDSRADGIYVDAGAIEIISNAEGIRLHKKQASLEAIALG